MTNTYVLIEGNRIDTGWRLLVDSYQKDVLEKQNSRFNYNLGAGYLHDKKPGLNVDNMGDYMFGYESSIKKHLEEGKTVLFNRSGGFMFLTDDMTILEKKELDYFPTLDKVSPNGLNGWLSPAGKFHPCEPSEHYVFASSYEGDDKDKFLKLSSSKFDMKHLSDVGIIDENQMTVAQFNWFKKHKHFLDERQMELLKEHKVF